MIYMIGRRYEGNATWLEVIYCLAHWPDEPLASWIVPGSYEEATP